MPQARGTQAAFNLYDEDTFGQDPTTPSGTVLHVKSFGVSSSQKLEQSETLSGTRGRSKPVQGNIDVAGDIAVEMAPESIGQLLRHAFGSNTDSGSDPYTHTLDIGALPTGMTLEKDYGANISGAGRVEKFNGCRVGSVKFEFPQSGFPMATFSTKGAVSALAASALDSSPTDNGHTPWSAFEASIEEGGSSIAIVTACEFTLDNGLDDGDYVIGSNERAQLPEGFATVSGQITALFEDPTLLNKAINGTSSSLKITLSRGDGLGSAGNESLEFNLQQLLYERQSPPVEGPKGILITLPFQVFRSGANLGLQAVLKNALATI